MIQIDIETLRWTIANRAEQEINNAYAHRKILHCSKLREHVLLFLKRV